MKRLNELADALYRKRNSIYFRLLCVCYALIIVLVHTNIFPFWYYIVAILVYISFYYYLLFKNNYLRLLCDYLFILFTIWGKDNADITSLMFILLPIFNAINFSGTKRNPYLLSLYAMATYVVYVYPDIDVLSIIIAFSSVFFIDYYSALRWKLNIFQQKLLDHVDEFYTVVSKPHKIYNQAIADINEFLGRDYVKNIFCMIRENGTLHIVNSSIFTFTFKISPNLIQEDKLKNNLIVYNVDFLYDKNKSEYNIVYPVRSIQGEDVTDYVFILVLKRRLPVYRLLSGVLFLIETFFTRIAKVLHNEKKLRQIKRETIKDLRNKARFVERSVNTMHFIRNRLSPYKTLIQTIDMRYKSSQDMKEKLDKIIMQQNKIAQKELEQIISKANYLLEKDNNPFSYNEMEFYSVGKIFALVRALWNESFQEQNFQIEEFNIEDTERYKILSNFDGLDILFSDWIGNMYKYQKGNVWCQIKIENEGMVIKFLNDYKSSDREIKELISDFNKDDRQQITRRTTHGIYIMKQIISELNIKH